ncbi:MAG: peptidase M23 [Candidatus Rokuibacteriota bacterium]|nr:MAG: peptidase M23 [Candidatus Rokubacteria bacterium]
MPSAPSTLALALGVAAVVAPATPLGDLVPVPPVSVAETAVRRGDTLEGALGRLRLPRQTAALVGLSLRRLVDLRGLRPAEQLFIGRAQDGRVLGLTYRRSLLERYEVRPDDAGWRAEQILTPIETRVVAVGGTVEGSLFAAMDRLGEAPLLTALFVGIFETNFDFAAEALPGDRFRLLVEKRYADGAFAGYGRILIAQYQSGGRRALTGVAFQVAGARPAYYDAEGRSVEKMFLRAPLDFTRITSGYSHARHHPILGGVRPHLAIDYGAPIGTPVRAVADGVVTRTGWDSGNGITITLRHARGYETMYNHLSAVEVRPGQRVHQRQVIGLVGTTGLSTGPHLDYRVRKNGSFVNPLSERFVPGPELPPRQRPAFAERLHTLLELLNQDAPFRP